jgi:hypothetical protein
MNQFIVVSDIDRFLTITSEDTEPGTCLEKPAQAVRQNGRSRVCIIAPYNLFRPTDLYDLITSCPESSTSGSLHTASYNCAALPIKNAHDPVPAVRLISLLDYSRAWIRLNPVLTPECRYRAIVHPSLVRVVPHRPAKRKPDTSDQVPKTNWIWVP